MTATSTSYAACSGKSVRTTCRSSHYNCATIHPQDIGVTIFSAAGSAGIFNQADFNPASGGCRDEAEDQRDYGGRHIGAFVRATLDDYAGRFDVIEPAVVATSAPIVGVGRWALAYKGQLGVCLRNLDILSAPGELGRPCPAATLSWDDGDSAI